MNPQRPSSLRLLRWLLLLAGVLVLALYIGLPAAMGIAAVFPARSAVGPPPPGATAVSLPLAEGETLAAWYIPPANGAAIILLHGAGGSRESLRPYIELLREAGFGVLALDARGHGQSAGPTNRLGWGGTADVGAALAFLQAQPRVTAVGGLGLSMGGETLLGAAATYPALRAIAADGATRRSTAELLALPSERPLVRNFTARVMYATVQALSSDSPPPPLLEAMLAADATRFLLIAGGENELEVAFNQLFAAALGKRAELWIVPGAGHTAGLSRDPAAYTERVIRFFSDTLLPDASSAAGNLSNFCKPLQVQDLYIARIISFWA